MSAHTFQRCCYTEGTETAAAWSHAETLKRSVLNLSRHLPGRRQGMRKGWYAQWVEQGGEGSVIGFRRGEAGDNPWTNHEGISMKHLISKVVKSQEVIKQRNRMVVVGL